MWIRRGPACYRDPVRCSAAAALCAAMLAAGPVAAREPAEGPVAVGALWSENFVEEADKRAAAGDLAGAAEFYFRAHDRLADDRNARLLVGAMHEPLEKGVNAAVVAQARNPRRTDLLCEADRRILRHAAELSDAERLNSAVIAVLRAARSRVQARLRRAGAGCLVSLPSGTSSLLAIDADELSGQGHRGRVLEPGSLAIAARTSPPPLPHVPARRDRGRVWTRAGVAMMAAGLMSIGAGIALSTLDRREADAPAALGFVAGAGMFFAGFPLLIVGDQRRRASALAIGPGRLTLSF